MAGAGLVSLLALSAPVDDNGRLGAGGATGPVLAAGLPSFTNLPAGWPGPLPDLATEWEFKVWKLVFQHCERFGLPEQALVMYKVLWEESRLLPGVRSSCGRYHGIGQFTKSTFARNVVAMKRLGLLAETAVFTPMNPEHAIEVMAWMWSQGYEEHWGPYRRVVRQLARARASEPVN